MTKDSELLQRIKNGSGEDRELDADLQRHFGLPQCLDDWRLTSDLNAVFALVERELPGVSGERTNYCTNPGWDDNEWGVKWMLSRHDFRMGTYVGDVKCPTQNDWWNPSVNCRTLLLALLAAKEQKS